MGGHGSGVGGDGMECGGRWCVLLEMRLASGIAEWREERVVDGWCADDGMVSLCVYPKRAIYYCVWYKVSPRVLVVLFYPF